MAQLVEERYAFVAEWHDLASDLLRIFHLIYYPRDGSIELFDVKSRKTFLKRTNCETLRAEDLYLGSKINVYSRQLMLKDYADHYTKEKLESRRERTLGIVKPDAFKSFGKIIARCEELGLQIGHLRMVHLTREQAEQFYSVHHGKFFFENLISFMTSGPCVAFEIMGNDAIQEWRKLIGPTSTEKARAEAPQSVRALYGYDNTANAVHGSDARETAQQELDFFFGPEAKFQTTATFENSTLGIVKPHIIRHGKCGVILDAIMEAQFHISAAQMFSVDRVNAEEFFEVYKGVVPEYSDMSSQLISGPCIALEICGNDSVVQAFRDLCGPADPEIARHLRPNTLRAQFGEDKIRNAVHCTDLPEDGKLEVEYFFKILQD